MGNILSDLGNWLHKTDDDFNGAVGNVANSVGHMFNPGPSPQGPQQGAQPSQPMMPQMNPSQQGMQIHGMQQGPQPTMQLAQPPKIMGLNQPNGVQPILQPHNVAQQAAMPNQAPQPYVDPFSNKTMANSALTKPFALPATPTLKPGEQNYPIDINDIGSAVLHGAESTYGGLANIGQTFVKPLGQMVGQGINAVIGHPTPQAPVDQNYTDVIHNALPAGYDTAQQHFNQAGVVGQVAGGAADLAGQLLAPVPGPRGIGSLNKTTGEIGNATASAVNNILARTGASKFAGGLPKIVAPMVGAGTGFGAFNAFGAMENNKPEDVPGEFGKGFVEGVPFGVPSVITNNVIRPIVGAGVGAVSAGVQQAFDPNHTFDPANYAQNIVMGAHGASHATNPQIDPNAVKEAYKNSPLSNEDGFVAGPLAGDFSKAQNDGKVFPGVDGKQRFEVGDQGAKLNTNYPIENYPGSQVRYAKLGDMLDHPALYANYPELQNIDVALTPHLKDSEMGVTRDANNIEINAKLLNNPTQLKSTLIHEVQHVIQNKEGFTNGGSTELEPHYRILLDNYQKQFSKVENDMQNTSDPHQQEVLENTLQDLDAKIYDLTNKSQTDYKNLAGEAEARAVQSRINMPDSERYVKPDTSYQGSHQINDGVPIHKANLDDVVNQIKGKYGLSNNDYSDIKKLKSMAANPNAEVKIYRASPANELNSGDWVTTNKSYANDIKRQNGGKVHEYTAKVSDLNLPKNIEDNPSLARFSAFQYTKATQPRSTFYDSLDVPKKDLIIKRDKTGKAMSISQSDGSLKHFTTPEVAAQLRAGTPFDYTKEPIHGTGGKDFGANTARMVDDGKPALYLSLDDKTWNTGLKPNRDAKLIDISNYTPDQLNEFAKNGGTSSFNYKTQSWEGRENAFTKTPLEGVEYHVDPQARKLVIDSPNKLDQVSKSVGKHPDDPEFWTALRSKYDVVELRDVKKSSQVSEAENKIAKRFFSAAKGDQAIVLNQNSVKIKQATPAPSHTVAPVHDMPESDSNLTHELASRYSSLDQYINEAVDRIWANNKKGAGTDIVHKNLDAQGEGSNTYEGTRISNNTPYYRAKFEETGKAPTKSGIKQDVIDFLNGKDNAMQYELHPDERQVADLLKERDDHLNAVTSGQSMSPSEEASKYKSVQDYLDAHSYSAKTPEELLKGGPVPAPLDHDVLHKLQDREAKKSTTLNIDRGRLQEADNKGQKTNIYIKRVSETSSQPDALSDGQSHVSQDTPRQQQTDNQSADQKNQKRQALKLTSRPSVQEDASLARQSSKSGQEARRTVQLVGDKTKSQAAPELSNSKVEKTNPLSAPSDKTKLQSNNTADEAKKQHPTIERDQKILDILHENKHDPENGMYTASSLVMKETGKTLGESEAEVQRVIDQTNFDTKARGERLLHPAGGDHMIDINKRSARKIILEAKNAREGEKMNIAARHEILDQKLKKAYKGHDEGMALLDTIEHPESLEDNLKKIDPKRHEAFQTALKDARAFNAYVEQRQADLGAPVKHRDDYLHHNVDFTKPAPEEAISEVLGTHPKAKYEKKREYDDIRAMYANGDKLVHEDPRDLFRDYAHTATKSIAGQRMVDELNNNAPGHIAIVSHNAGMQPIDKNGRKFSTMRVPGLESYYVSPDLTKHVDDMVEPKDYGKVARGVDMVNQGLKQTMLMGGGFHDFNVTKRFVTQEFGSGILGEPGRLVKMIPRIFEHDTAFFSHGQYVKQIEKYRNSGLLDRVTTGPGRLTLKVTHDTGSLNEKSDVSAVEKATTLGKKAIQLAPKANHYLHEFLFGRKIPLMKLQTAEAELQRAKIPLTGELTPQQSVKVADITRRINDLYGGINSGFIAKTKYGKYVQRQLMLAPDFTGGNINSVAGMFHGTAKGLAARQNISNLVGSLVMYGVLTGAIAQLQGKDGAQEAEKKVKSFFDPSSPAFLKPNFDTGLKDKKGNELVATFPGSPIEEAGKLVADPVHFFESRGSAGVGDVTKMVSNKNYYGDPLVDPFTNPNPTVGDKAAAALQSNLPIPAQQGGAFASGNQGALPTALNVAGFRVGKDPTDPQVIQENQYFKAVDDAKKGLNPNDMAAYNLEHQQTKDRSGNYVIEPTVWDKPEKAAVYLAHPNVLDADAKINQQLAAQGQNVDPFWTRLTHEQQMAVLASRTMIEGGADKAKFNQDNKDWLPAYQQLAGQFYDSLPPGDPNRPKVLIQPPKQTPELQAMFQAYDGLDPQDKAQYMKDHPELPTYIDSIAQYNNQIRQAKGYDPLRTYPKADPTVQTFMDQYFAADKPTRTAMRTGNNDLYLGMQNYMANMDRYGMDKEASTDQLIGKGQDNYTAPSQAYDKHAFALGQYDIAKGTDANGKPAYQWFPSTNTASGSTANTSPITKITQGGPGFKGIMGYNGSGSGGGSSKQKKQKKQRIKFKHPRVHYHKIHINKHIGVNVPGAHQGKITLAKAKKVGAIKLV